MTTYTHQSKNVWKKIFLIFFLIVLVSPFLTFAQDDRSYFYEKISQNFTVNQDTTVDVEEIQTYNFKGEYHKGWRSIPLKGVSSVEDVKVYDENGSSLSNSLKSLDKTNPNSWGKYYYRKNNGNLEIEWYYNAKDETKTWIIKYKLIGALSFLKDKDELYWNLFTNYDVPIKIVEAKVSIPSNDNLIDNNSARIYVSGGDNAKYEILDNKTFSFYVENVPVLGEVTIASGWPRGLINRKDFWFGLLRQYVTFEICALIVFLTLLTIFLRWYLTEKRGKGKGTIIPEYEPPQNLPPAIAEVVVKESLTPKAWVATIIDLAVRGYVKIKEEERPNYGKIISAVFSIIVLSVFVLLYLKFAIKDLFGVIIFLFLLPIFLSLFKKGVSFKDYSIEKVKDFENDLSLKPYEKQFLSVLLFRGFFSTKDVRSNRLLAQQIYQALQNVKKTVYSEIDNTGNIFEKPISKDSYVALSFFIVIFIFAFGASFLSQALGEVSFIFITLLACLIILISYWKFEARLSKEGAILKDDWLGFKLYLETAERYRMQFAGGRITPETFEKYLPYAIIFGVEKKWGQAFDGIVMRPPSWYGIGAGINSSSSIGSGNMSSFSAGVFSSSFASSFSSAFSSSGGGASGGSGGAGGGGGGGGGGAS